ncbi:hypothetical protein [Pseudomonas sp. BLCC-B112]|uniref:hypothetical protein n=1 Tax=Pseudomonas sp. BLCC-B112 TaxID=3025319 RepID=UPI00234D8ECA|nr:hypothetical protein [Pseudomonas sp. BLCC-B112]MDC7813726.1 hypothetical protein [Pseudomonas sp. BLCC-B112]
MADEKKQYVSLSVDFGNETSNDRVQEVDAELLRHGWQRSVFIASTYECIHVGNLSEVEIKAAIEMILKTISSKYDLKHCAYVLQVGNAALTGGRVTSF